MIFSGYRGHLFSKEGMSLAFPLNKGKDIVEDNAVTVSALHIWMQATERGKNHRALIVCFGMSQYWKKTEVGLTLH